ADAVLDTPIGDSIRAMFFDESVASWITAQDYPDEARARAAVNAQEIGVAVIIPENFTARYLNDEKDVQVLIISDPTLSIGPAVVQDMVTMMLDGVASGGIAIQTLMERQQANGLVPDPSQIPGWIARYQTWYTDFQRDLFHHPDRAALILTAPSAGESDTTDPIRKMLGLTIVGQMIFFAFFTGAYSMMNILHEAEEGTLARLFITPTSRITLLTGKFVAVFLTVILQGVVLLIAGHYAFGVTWGNPLAIILALFAQVVAATGLGVFLISFVKTTKQGGPVLGGGLTFLGMLGGLFTSNIPGLPAIFGTLSQFTPQGWVLKSWQNVIAGQSLNQVWLPISVAVLMGLVMFTVGAMRFKRRYA
ncbi:MAG TPA: ABC transporter permease, partial [Anaerolineales bacterium]|nr:ABC transporter permease [Anaerolineales bacterium]